MVQSWSGLSLLLVPGPDFQTLHPFPGDSSPLSDPAWRTAGENSETEAIIVLHTYSNVVALRPPSPREERPTLPFERSYIDYDFLSASASCIDDENLNDVNDSICNDQTEIVIHTLGDFSNAPVSQEDSQLSGDLQLGHTYEGLAIVYLLLLYDYTCAAYHLPSLSHPFVIA